jgi:hypothetical protein
MIKLTTTIPFCATVGKTFLDDATTIVNMYYNVKDNYTEKYCTTVCSPEAKNV